MSRFQAYDVRAYGSDVPEREYSRVDAAGRTAASRSVLAVGAASSRSIPAKRGGSAAGSASRHRRWTTTRRSAITIAPTSFTADVEHPAAHPLALARRAPALVRRAVLPDGERSSTARSSPARSHRLRRRRASTTRRRRVWRRATATWIPTADGTYFARRRQSTHAVRSSAMSSLRPIDVVSLAARPAAIVALRVVCGELRRRQASRFAIAGRDREKLEAIATQVPPTRKAATVDPTAPPGGAASSVRTYSIGAHRSSRRHSKVRASSSTAPGHRASFGEQILGERRSRPTRTISISAAIRASSTPPTNASSRRRGVPGSSRSVVRRSTARSATGARRGQPRTVCGAIPPDDGQETCPGRPPRVCGSIDGDAVRDVPLPRLAVDRPLDDIAISYVFDDLVLSAAGQRAVFGRLHDRGLAWRRDRWEPTPCALRSADARVNAGVEIGGERARRIVSPRAT